MLEKPEPKKGNFRWHFGHEDEEQKIEWFDQPDEFRFQFSQNINYFTLRSFFIFLIEFDVLLFDVLAFLLSPFTFFSLLIYVRKKCSDLAKLIKNASNIVVYTGAGISTSARLPDYRGKDGMWTNRDAGM